MMWLVITVAESVLLIFGSLTCAMLLCLLLWYLLRPLHHPELGALILAALFVATLTLPFPHSPFLRLTLLFATVGAVPLWIAGRQWRRQQRVRISHGGANLSPDAG